MDYYDIVKNEPLFWTRIGLGANPDIRDEKGNITFINSDWDDYLKEHEVFLKSGCRLHTSVIHSGWVGENEYDYSATDKTLETIFSLGEDVLYLPRVELNAPLEWLKANPEEIALACYANKTPESVAEVYKSYRTDVEIANVRCGVVNEYGVYLQSFFSEKWLNDAKEALIRFVKRLENGKYGSRIVGYQLAYGMCGEVCNWGAWKSFEHWGDFSKPANEAFLKFCIQKYGSLDAAKKAYGEELTPENIIPHPGTRCRKNEDISSYFRVNDKRATDFSICLSERAAGNICEFAAAAKQEADKPMGAFYGYLLTKFPTETGHIGIQKLMDCENVDFLSAPKIYYRCGAGEPGGSQATSMSVARKKIWLDELDNDTHIATSYQEESNHPENFFETKTILWREVARNLAWHNQNFWWMDLYGGWFMDEEIQAEIGKIIKFNKKMREKPYKSVSEILFITDEKALAYQTADEYFTGCRTVGILNEMGAELKLCGAPVDEYRLHDLYDLDLSQYKMIVFSNAFKIDEYLREIIRNIPKTTLCVWNYAAGIRNGEQFDFSNVKSLTGMEIEPCLSEGVLSNGYGSECKLPPLKIKESKEIEVSERYESGDIKIAKCNNHLLIVSPGFYAEDFNRLAKESGCHMYTSHGCAVFADERFVGVFPGKNGANSLCFKGNGIYKDLISGENAENIKQLCPKGAYIFVKEW